MDITDDPLANAELLSLEKGLCFSDYAISVIAQNPGAYEISKRLVKQKTSIIKSHPIAYNGQRKSKVINTKIINILFAGTYKVFLSRPYIYPSSYQFFDTIKEHSLQVFKKFQNKYFF